MMLVQIVTVTFCSFLLSNTSVAHHPCLKLKDWFGVFAFN